MTQTVVNVEATLGILFVHNVEMLPGDPVYCFLGSISSARCSVTSLIRLCGGGIFIIGGGNMVPTEQHCLPPYYDYYYIIIIIIIILTILGLFGLKAFSLFY